MLKLLSFAVKLAAIALVMFIQIDEARAAWGDFDTTFGFQGAAIDTVTGYHPRSVAVQPDGRILVTGSRTSPTSGDRFFLRRYLSNGSLDTTFGTNGAAVGPETNTFSTEYRGEAIVILSSGKIAVAGWANGANAVWQFTSAGKQDKTFGTDGLQLLTGYSPSIPELNIQAGKLLLTIRKQVGSDSRVALVRLNADGTLDTHFGSGGESLTNASGVKASGTVIESSGAITIAGVRYNDASAKGLERKLSNGQDDTGFTPATSTVYGPLMSGLAKLSTGKYAMRWANIAGNGSLTLVIDRYAANGVLDQVISFYNGYGTSRCPEIFTSQNDGKLVLQFAGLLFRTPSQVTGPVEMNDCSNLIGMTDLSRAALQTDDKMIAAGVYNNYLMLVRMLPN